MKTDVERLVHEGLSLARTMARKIQQRLGAPVASDELLALAEPTLFEAARNYDPDRSPFAPYLAKKLKWAMLDEVRKLRGRPQVSRRAAACIALERVAEDDAETEAEEKPLRTEEEYQSDLKAFLARRAAAMVLGLASTLPDPQEPLKTPEEDLARQQLWRDLLAAVQKLPDRQRALVERHYFGGEKFESIATDLGISKSRASRIHTEAMETLAAALRDRH